MHDIRAIRENPAAFDAALSKRACGRWSLKRKRKSRS